MAAVMHQQSDTATFVAAVPCDGCGALFAPKRPWQRFCKSQCRTDYHQAHGHEGSVKAVRRLKRGWSVVVHMADAESLELGTAVKVVRA